MQISTHYNNFNTNKSSCRFAYDKVVPYDANSLLDSVDKDLKTKSTDKRLGLIKRRGNQSTKNSDVISVNEQFNKNLIKHGTENGVPQYLMPKVKQSFEKKNESNQYSTEPTTNKHRPIQKVLRRPPSGKITRNQAQ